MRLTLTPGQKAPRFATVDVKGNPVKLALYEGHNVLVVFLRYSGCPWCNLAIHRLSLEYPLLKERDCEVIAFVQSTPKNILKNIYERHDKKPPFPVIADQERVFYKKYGVRLSAKATARSIVHIPQWVHSVKKHGFKQKEIDGSLFLAPAVFLIGRDSEIINMHYSASLYEHETFTDIYDQLFLKM